MIELKLYEITALKRYKHIQVDTHRLQHKTRF